MASAISGVEAHMWSLANGGGAAIKSIQAGVTDIAGTQVSVNVAIAAVNLSKTFVICIAGGTSTTGGSDSVDTLGVAAQLTSSTNLLLARETTGLNSRVSWQVIEFGQGASVQQVVSDSSTVTTDVTIAAVDPARTFMLSSWNNSIASTTIQAYGGYVVRTILVNATTLRFQRGGTGASHMVAFVVEIK